MLLLAARLASELVTETTILALRYTIKGAYYGTRALYRLYAGVESTPNNAPVEASLEQQIQQLQSRVSQLQKASQQRQHTSTVTNKRFEKRLRASA